ncbi:DUF3986 family protein [Brevibacillus gelatini]|uniref:DUF3986 family protein n=1 Tax=Brevibacillus gelatini TaxID=1655277 RepID=UPI003D8181FD
MLNWDKMEQKYEMDRHFHVTYCEDGYDIEGSAWKKKNGQGWAVLFADHFHDLGPSDTAEDIVIFHYEKDELDVEEMNKLFAKWVNEVLLPRAKDKSLYQYQEV